MPEYPPDPPPDGVPTPGAATPVPPKKGKSPKTTNKGWATIALAALSFAATMYASPEKMKDPAVITATLAAIATGTGLIQAKDDD